MSSDLILLDIKKTAAMLGGVSQRTVERFAAEGLLHVTRIGGRVLFHKDDISNFIEAQRNASRKRREQQTA